jgi:hypothetical protein
MAMANNPLTGQDSGKIGLPTIDAGMNKIGPDAMGGGKGGKGFKLSKSETQKLLEKARKRFTRASDGWSENNKAALDDLKFKQGDQWPADVQKQRGADQRPCLTINKMLTIVHQVTNDLRQNRPQIKINPVGDGADQKVARHLGGLIRAIERDSAADIAYDTMADNAVSNGYGFCRVITEYETPASMDQVIHIKRIRNPFTVYLDPDHQEPDGADCRYAFVTEMMPRDEFEDMYPDADPMPWNMGGVGNKVGGWVDKDNIRVAEYFEVKISKRTVVALSNGHVGWEDELDDLVLQKIKTGSVKITDSRVSDCRKIMWYKLTALDVLDSREWPGVWIPVVKMIGDEIDVEGKVTYSGVIRHAKDAQRMVNYWRTLQTEKVALAPKAKWLMEEGQIDGHDDEWRNAHNNTSPVLQYKAVGLAGMLIDKPTMIQPQGVDANLESAIQGSAMDMMATTGVQFDNNQNDQRQDASGRAIREARRSGDLGSFHYTDNMSRSLMHMGRILIDLIPKIYDTKRQIILLQEDDKEQVAMIDPAAGKPIQKVPHPTEPNKQIDAINPTIGRYGVTVTVGPSYATRRIEAAESMMQFVQAMPNVAAAVPDLIAKNMDWDGSDEFARRLVKMIPPQLLAPDMADVPPQVQAMLQAMQKNIQQLTLERNQMMLAIKSKDADRRIAQDKVNKDFEAKLLAVVQKAEASANKDVAASLKQLAAEVVQFGQALGQYQDGLDDIAGIMSEQQQSDDATAKNQISMDPASLFAAVQPKAPKGRMNAR